MSLFKWLRGENNNDISDAIRFSQLIKDNNRLQHKLDAMYRACRRCGDELYKRTGDVNHLMPEHWMKETEDDKI